MSRSWRASARSALRWVFVAATVAWAIALPASAWLAGQPSESAVAYWIAYVIYRCGGLVCHQLPVRSFHLAGVAIPVCARCAGIYGGAAVAALVVGPSSHRGRMRDDGSPDAVASRRRALVLALVPTLVTLAFEWTTGRMPAGWIRAAAGVPAGAAVAWLVLRATQAEVN